MPRARFSTGWGIRRDRKAQRGSASGGGGGAVSQRPPLPATAREYWHSELQCTPAAWVGQITGLSMAGGNTPVVAVDGAFFNGRVVAQTERATPRYWANYAAGTVLATGTRPWKYTIARMRVIDQGVITSFGLASSDDMSSLGVVGGNFASYSNGGSGYLIFGPRNTNPHRAKEWREAPNRYLDMDGTVVSVADGGLIANATGVSAGVSAAIVTSGADASIAFYLLCTAKPTDPEIAALDAWSLAYWGV